MLASAQIVWTTNALGEVGADQPDVGSIQRHAPRGNPRLGWIQAVHPDDRQQTRAVWSRAVGDLHPLLATEYRLPRRHDGEYRHMAVRGAPVLEAGGHIQEWVGTCTGRHRAKAGGGGASPESGEVRVSLSKILPAIYIATPEGIPLRRNTRHSCACSELLPVKVKQTNLSSLHASPEVRESFCHN